NLEDRYVTLSAAVIDPKSHRIELVSAGHLSPWVYRQREKKLRKVFDKDSGDFPVGWVAGHAYTAYPIELAPGDSLLVYNDGIEDAQPAKGERFTEEGVRRTVAAASKAMETVSARELGARIVHAVVTHAGNHPQFDDIAMVCFGRVTGNVNAEDDELPT